MLFVFYPTASKWLSWTQTQVCWVKGHAFFLSLMLLCANSVSKLALTQRLNFMMILSFYVTVSVMFPIKENATWLFTMVNCRGKHRKPRVENVSEAKA